MKDCQARVYAQDPEPALAVFDDKGMAQGPGVFLSLVSVLDVPGLMGSETLVSVVVNFDENARPETAASYLYENLVGDNNAILMLYDEAACSVQEVENMLRRESTR